MVDLINFKGKDTHKKEKREGEREKNRKRWISIANLSCVLNLWP